MKNPQPFSEILGLDAVYDEHEGPEFSVDAVSGSSNRVGEEVMAHLGNRPESDRDDPTTRLTAVPSPPLVQTRDPLDLYVLEMGIHELLTNEQEVQLGIEMEEGRRMIFAAVCACPANVAEALSRYESFPAGKLDATLLVESAAGEANDTAVWSGATETDDAEHAPQALDSLFERLRHLHRREISVRTRLGLGDASVAAMRDELRDTLSWIRLAPATVERLADDVDILLSEMSGLQRSLLDTCVQNLGLSEKQLRDMQQMDKNTISLHSPVGNDGDSAMGDFIVDSNSESPVDTLDSAGLHTQVRQIMGALNLREADVLALRYGIGSTRAQTLDEIGKMYGVFRERIRQIERDAMKRLRDHGVADHLRDFI